MLVKHMNQDCCREYVRDGDAAEECALGVVPQATRDVSPPVHRFDSGDGRQLPEVMVVRSYFRIPARSHGSKLSLCKTSFVGPRDQQPYHESLLQHA